VNKMEYIYAALLLHKAGKKIDENGVKAVLTAAGVAVDESRVKALIAALDGVNIEDAISKAAAAPVAAAAAPVAAAAAPAAKEEAPEEHKKEDEESGMAGLGALFG
jgi:large subunit ribosomal protein L12